MMLYFTEGYQAAFIVIKTDYAEIKAQAWLLVHFICENPTTNNRAIDPLFITAAGAAAGFVVLTYNELMLEAVNE